MQTPDHLLEAFPSKRVALAKREEWQALCKARHLPGLVVVQRIKGLRGQFGIYCFPTMPTNGYRE